MFAPVVTLDEGYHIPGEESTFRTGNVVVECFLENARLRIRRLREVIIGKEPKRRTQLEIGR